MPEGPGNQYYSVCQVSVILFNMHGLCLAFAVAFAIAAAASAAIFGTATVHCTCFLECV